ncbi:MAG: glycerol-3-phosphate acyltransferase [Chloroflexota bacterium]|nr:glycerol-3-phosphate acyltransferase [Chloroflexota bacterium]
MSVGEILGAVGIVLGAYLVGSVPFGVLVCRVGFGVDVFAQGSRRSGATNVMRAVGFGPAALVIVGDLLKGFLPGLAARLIFGEDSIVPVLAVTAAVAGHNWSVFLRLRGGRGVVTAVGGLAAMAPIVVAIALPAGLLAAAISRYVSVGSLTGSLTALLSAAIFYAVGGWITGYDLLLAAGLAFFMFTQHIDNMRRIVSGTERRLPAWAGLIGGRNGRNRGSSLS